MNSIQKYLFCLVMLTSCKVDISLYKFCNFFSSKTTKSTLEKSSWSYDQPLNFDFSIQDISAAYDICLVIKYDYTYPFYNIHINYTVYAGKNEALEQGIRNINLFDSFTGKSLGFSLLPNTKTIEFLVLKDYKFSQTGEYSFVLQHGMRTLNLPGIKGIDLKLISK